MLCFDPMCCAYRSNRSYPFNVRTPPFDVAQGEVEGARKTYENIYNIFFIRHRTYKWRNNLSHTKNNTTKSKAHHNWHAQRMGSIYDYR